VDRLLLADVDGTPVTTDFRRCRATLVPAQSLPCVGDRVSTINHATIYAVAAGIEFIDENVADQVFDFGSCQSRGGENR
jgi:hypothetical protein